MSTLTEQQKNDNVAALRAAYDGKPWQYHNGPDEPGTWITAGPQTHPAAYLISNGYNCRPAPEPEPPRPWDCADDVPGPVCWIRPKGEPHNCYLVIEAGQGCKHIKYGTYGSNLPFNKQFEYSTDRKTWKPCHKQP